MYASFSNFVHSNATMSYYGLIAVTGLPI